MTNGQGIISPKAQRLSLYILLHHLVFQWLTGDLSSVPHVLPQGLLFAPLLASSFAVASPIPLEAPVKMTTFPSTCNMHNRPFLCSFDRALFSNFVALGLKKI